MFLQYPESLKLPKNVCESCFDKARDVYHFQQVCYKSLEQILQESSQQHSKVESSVPHSNATQANAEGVAKVSQDTCKSPELPAESNFYLEGIETSDNPDQDAEDVEEEDNRMGDDFCSDENSETHTDDLDEILNVSESEALVKSKKAKVANNHSSKETATVTSSAPGNKYNYGCSQCAKYFISLKKLMDHTEAEHDHTPGATVKIYMCKNCMKKFESEDNLRNHELECDDSEILAKPFSCNICSARFTYNRQLKEHILAEHESQKRYSCTQCPMKFTRSSQVTVHMRGHTNEKPYQCEECQASFAKKTNMVRHMKTHGSDACFVCSLCPKAFKWETSLRVHMNTHTKNKRYKCDYCYREYGSMSGYRKHVAATHKTK